MSTGNLQFCSSSDNFSMLARISATIHIQASTPIYMGRHFIVAIKPGHAMYTEYTIMHLQATGHSYIIRCGESMQYYVKPDLQL